MPNLNDAADHLRKRGIPAEVVAGVIADSDQGEAWVAQAAPIAMHARHHGNAGEWEAMAGVLGNLVPLFAQIDVDPHSPAGTVINKLLAHLAELAEELHQATHKS